MIYAVIGSNYGDEGKGLATDFLASRPGQNLVIRHNGGAQSGHTVETGGKRFVFHELSSGSFRGADTYWADSFFPDLYKLGDEVRSFRGMTGFVPLIYSSPMACITTIDDILINMLLESSRGEKRHGSCGMGINEADMRKKAGFAVPIGNLSSFSAEALFCELKRIRSEYSLRRMHELNLDLQCDNEYSEMLGDEMVLRNFTETVIGNCRYFETVDNEKICLSGYDNIIFEGGQGLRLDAEFEKSLPNVTASRTGLANVLRILDENEMKLNELLYVTRSYVTKHGAGSLKNECSELPGNLKITDETNVHNKWQGSLRFSRWDDVDDLMEAILADLENCTYPIKTSLLVTHLNETENKMLFLSGDMDIESFMQNDAVYKTFNQIYLSSTRFSDDIRM